MEKKIHGKAIFNRTDGRVDVNYGKPEIVDASPQFGRTAVIPNCGKTGEIVSHRGETFYGAEVWRQGDFEFILLEDGGDSYGARNVYLYPKEFKFREGIGFANYEQ